MSGGKEISWMHMASFGRFPALLTRRSKAGQRKTIILSQMVTPPRRGKEVVRAKEWSGG